MSHQALTALFAATLTALSIPAQVGSPVLGTDDLPAAWAGMTRILDIEVERGAGQRLAVFLAARRPGATDFDLIAGEWDLQTGEFSEVSGLGMELLNNTADQSSVTTTDDLLHLIYDSPNGPRIASRTSTTKPFGPPRGLGNLPNQPADPCFMTDNILLYRMNGDIWATAIDPSAQTPVEDPGVPVVPSADIAMSSGFAIPVGAGGGPSGGSGGSGSYASSYTYRRNGTVKKCTSICVENGVQEVATLSSSTNYYGGPPATGGCVLGGTQFFADSSTGGIHVAHFLNVLTVVIPTDEAGSVDYPVQAPIEGLSGTEAAQMQQTYLLAGVFLRAPVQWPNAAGQLGVLPLIALPLAAGQESVELSYPAGLAAGTMIDFQPATIDASSPYIAFGSTGSVIVR